MNAALDLFAKLLASDIHLEVREGRLHVNAPKGFLTPEVRTAVTNLKADLLNFIQKSEGKEEWVFVTVPHGTAGRRIDGSGSVFWPKKFTTEFTHNEP